MEYKITKLQNDKGLDIDIVNIINSNNYSFSFYTYGGYMSEVCIPTSSNVSETEDVLLGYANLDDCLEAHGYFNSIIGKIIEVKKFSLPDNYIEKVDKAKNIFLNNINIEIDESFFISDNDIFENQINVVTDYLKKYTKFSDQKIRNRIKNIFGYCI